MGAPRSLGVLLAVLQLCYYVNAQDACFQTKQVCFADPNLSSTDVAVACPLLSGVKNCLENAGCTISDVIYDAVINTAFTSLQERCQDYLCMSKYRACVSSWNDFGENLATFQLLPTQGLAMCTALFSAPYLCDANLPTDCAVAGLAPISDIMTELLLVQMTQFCNQNPASCILRGLKCTPSSYLNFAELGYDYFRTCLNETVSYTCTVSVGGDCPSAEEYSFVTNIGSGLVSHCELFSTTEAQRCFANVLPTDADPIAAVCVDDTIAGCLENALQLPSSSQDQAAIQGLVTALNDACATPEPEAVCPPDLTECFDQFCVYYPHACNFGSSEEGGSSEKSGTSEEGSSSEEWIRNKRGAVKHNNGKNEKRKNKKSKKKCNAAEYTLTCVVDMLDPCDKNELDFSAIPGFRVAQKLAKYYKKHCGEIDGLEQISHIKSIKSK